MWSSILLRINIIESLDEYISNIDNFKKLIERAIRNFKLRDEN